MKMAFALLLCFLTISNSKLSEKSTPQALNLQNHYGESSINSHYGTNVDPYSQFIEQNKPTFVPFLNGKTANLHELPLNQADKKYYDSNPIKSGSLSFAPAATEKFIKPEVVGPKYKVKTKALYPKIVERSILVGKESMRNVSAYDKKTGQVIRGRVNVSNAPKYQKVREVRYAPVTHEMIIDAKTGSLIEDKAEEKKVFHGKDDKPAKRKSETPVKVETQPLKNQK